MSFHRSSGVTILGGEQTNIRRDQYLYHLEHSRIGHLEIQRSTVNNYYPQKRIQTIWDNYREICTGDIYLVDMVGRTTYIEHERDTRRLDPVIRADRSFYKALVGEKGRECLYVKYGGVDALKAFQRDFEKYSCVKYEAYHSALPIFHQCLTPRNIHVAQLFGYSKSGLPALIFHDALIPIAHIFERNHLSPVLYAYFAKQFSLMHLQLNLNDRMALGILWIDPRTGGFRVGPHVGIASDRCWDIFAGPVLNNDPYASYLSIQAFSDNDSVLEYLSQTTSNGDILRGISFCSRTIGEWVTDDDAIYLLPSLPGTIYHRSSREVLAGWRGIEGQWYYELTHLIHDTLSPVWESKSIMENGLVRFTVPVVDLQQFQYLELRYELCPTSSWATLTRLWLSQAHHVFSRLRPQIQGDGWEEYGILGGFNLRLSCEGDRRFSDVLRGKILYLFLPPNPQPSDANSIWRTWTKGQKYFCSFDPLGKDEISAALQTSLGIPILATRIQIWHDFWDRTAYEAVQRLQCCNGSDTKPTDFICSAYFPTFEVDNYEDFEEETMIKLHPPH
ncbi:hypothetical protein WG66_010791 [Moniliophthora roreri]|nr:hypothetical protein WG66_010791 [Moniliophthora roreri]